MSPIATLRRRTWAVLVLGALAPSVRAQSLQVDAGPDRFLLPPATSLELHGTIQGLKLASVPRNLTIAWTQLSGPPAQILRPDRLAPELVAGQAGLLRLRLTVIDAHAGADSDEVLVYAFGADQDGVLGGELREWNKLTLTFQHDSVLSEGGTPNPFLDFRLVTQFYNLQSGAFFSVPGFFAADGNAAESSASSGNKWRVNFTPDHAGTWFYLTSFRSGAGVALETGAESGQAASFDGANGTFEVATADPGAPGFLARGRLEAAGGHHLRCAETHEPFLKGGTNSPENFLAYYEFDNTYDLGGATNGLNTSGTLDGLHHYAPHLADYADLGVPTWKNGKGKRIFGALNYLAARGVNDLYALTYNIDGGDGMEVWPWSTTFDKLRFDVSKLAQWERVIDHMMRCGIAWHLVTQETENDHELDGGALGTERKLYYRELVARFAHAPALIWNLGEENDNTDAQRKAFADYIRALDPYAHPIDLHNHSGDLDGAFGGLLGTHLEAASLQADLPAAAAAVQQLVDDSQAAGRPWAVSYDEQGPASDGAVPDADDFWHDVLRHQALWPTLFAGGAGCEWYFGYAHPNSDLDCEDFRSRDNLWRITTRSLDFLRAYLPFKTMSHADALASGAGAYVLAQRGEFYAVYLPFGGAALLDLEASTASFRVSWFDARNGGALRDGAVTQITGPGKKSLGFPPAAGDWVAFVRRSANLAPQIESIATEPEPFKGNQDFAVLVHASDPNGPEDELTVTVDVSDPGGNPFGTFPLVHRGGSLYSLFLRDRPPFGQGTWQLDVKVLDQGGLLATQSVSFTAE